MLLTRTILLPSGNRTKIGRTYLFLIASPSSFCVFFIFFDCSVFRFYFHKHKLSKIYIIINCIGVKYSVILFSLHKKQFVKLLIIALNKKACFQRGFEF